MKLAAPFFGLALLGAIGTAGYLGWERFGPQTVVASAEERIPTAPVTRGTLVRTVDSIGELKAARSSIINSPFSGQVISMVDEGVYVEEGEPVIWMDTQEFEDAIIEEETRLVLAQKDLEAAKEDYRLQEIQNDYNLQSEQAKVDLAEQRLKDAQQNYETEKILVERNISARTRLDEAELRMMQAAVELRNARINYKKTEENLASNIRIKQNAIDKAILDIERIEDRIEEDRERVEEATLRAPVAGEVTYLKVWRSGSLSKIAEGDNVWRSLSLAEIPDRTEMHAVIPVNELDIAAIEEGQTARIRLDAIPNKVFTGEVHKKSIVPIEPEENENAGPREFEVRIRITEQDNQLFQGMTAAVQIETARTEDALIIPLESLTTLDGALGVWKVNRGDGEFVSVQPVLMDGQYAALRDASLTEDDLVFLRNPGIPEPEARELRFAALEQARQALRGSDSPLEAAPDPEQIGG